jgi:4-aminobutyrate aminotransferase/(S)-3-amino-2-methylpropionate transaminase
MTFVDDLPQERRRVTDIPGPRSLEMLTRRRRAVPDGVYQVVPVFVNRAQGAIVEDVDGNLLIDFASGIGVLNVGNSIRE